MATNKEVAKAFFERRAAKSTNLTSNGTVLTSYYTPVMRWKGRNLCVNEKGIWSNTTKRQTNPVLAMVKDHNQKNPDNQITVIRDESIF